MLLWRLTTSACPLGTGAVPGVLSYVTKIRTHYLELLGKVVLNPGFLSDYGCMNTRGGVKTLHVNLSTLPSCIRTTKDSNIRHLFFIYILLLTSFFVLLTSIPFFTNLLSKSIWPLIRTTCNSDSVYWKDEQKGKQANVNDNFAPQDNQCLLFVH